MEKFNLFLPEHPPKQQSFLLRCIEVRNPNPSQEHTSGWLFSLQNPLNNAVYSFRDIAGLMTFLQSMLDENAETSSVIDEKNQD